MRVRVAGAGPDLVLLHGWGMNADVWGEIAALLIAQFRVHSVELLADIDLAGGPLTLDALVDAVATACVPRAMVCGWSLGGQVALRWARKKPAQIARIVLIGTNPCFVKRPGWDHGMESAVFDAFAENLTHDAGGTLQRFRLLQAHGDTAARTVARRLRECAAGSGDRDVAVLEAGLKILKDSDLRPALPGIGQPVLVLHGDRDSVVPLAAGEYLQRALPHAELDVVTGAAHAPFISQPPALAQRIARFCHG